MSDHESKHFIAILKIAYHSSVAHAHAQPHHVWVKTNKTEAQFFVSQDRADIMLKFREKVIG